MLALAVALGVAGTSALLTPHLLGWILTPPEAPELDFASLDSSRFRLAVFAIAAIAAAVTLLLSEPSQWPIWAPLAGLGSLLGLIDARTGFLPLRLHYLTLVVVCCGILASAWWRWEWSGLLWAVIGGGSATVIFWLVWRLSGGQLGFGDVRLAGLIGVAAGATSPSVLVWSFLLGSVVGAIWALAARLRGNQAFPYGPSMLLGAPLGLVAAAILPTAG